MLAARSAQLTCGWPKATQPPAAAPQASADIRDSARALRRQVNPSRSVRRTASCSGRHCWRRRSRSRSRPATSLERARPPTSSLGWPPGSRARRWSPARPTLTDGCGSRRAIQLTPSGCAPKPRGCGARSGRPTRPYWSVVFAGRTVRVRDLKGIRYLARLLAYPGRDFHVLDLVAAERGQTAAVERGHAAGLSRTGPGDAGEMLDARAKDAYRRRLAEIEDDIEQARALDDTEREAQADTERDFLVGRELSRAVGLGGRDRRAASTSERARGRQRHPRGPPGDDPSRRAPAAELSASISIARSAPAHTAPTLPTPALPSPGGCLSNRRERSRRAPYGTPAAVLPTAIY